MPATPTYNPILHDPATVGTQLATTCRYARYAEIIFQDDASGWQTFSYGKLGEVTENIRTFAPPFENQTYTFSMYFEYDSWNRIKSMTYPDGSAVQHLHYRPWGEDFVDQRSTSWNAMYTFSAKEKDTETGYSYFGSRYYSSDLSIWLSVDPKSDKYPSLSPYVYCANNPVRLVDPNGESIINPYKRLIDECNVVIMELEEGIKGQKYNYPSLAKAALATTKEELKEYTNYSRREYKQRHIISYDE